MTRRNHVTLKPYRARAIASSLRCAGKAKCELLKFNRVWLILLIVALPLILGGLASILMQSFLRPVPILVFKLDLGTVAFSSRGYFLPRCPPQSIPVPCFGTGRRGKRWKPSLQEAERSRNRFLRRLDHEIKNPLTGLQAALANLRESGSLQERERAARNADRAVERLSRLLTDLRKLSDLAERPLERLPVDIPQLLEEMIDAAHSQPAYGERPITLMITRVPWQLPPVTGDRDLLGLAVYNLIENALKFTSVRRFRGSPRTRGRKGHHHRSGRYRARHCA